MNPKYNKHREIAIVVFMFVAAIMAACSHQSKTNKSRLVDITDSCGINNDYYEVDDTTNDGYTTDSIIQLDNNGNIIKTPIR
uniref:Uncharacterized protein n=1 Tax=Geladintestivirus 4 TaxID=3233136 RepID=A0AAU8MHI4_9CAUD